MCIRFHFVQEPSKKRMKLLPVYLGVNKEGLMRIDIKTKEVSTKVFTSCDIYDVIRYLICGSIVY